MLNASEIKDISKDYSYFEDIEYAVARMDKAALPLLTYEEKSRDKELVRVQKNIRLGQRIMDHAFVRCHESPINVESLKATLEDALLVHQATNGNIDRLRASIVARKINPTSDLDGHSGPTLFQKLNGPEGFTAFAEKATKERRLINDMRGPF